MSDYRRLKVLISMIGLDGHSTGGEVVSKLLRDAGMEVIYLGAYQTPEMIAQAAIQEAVDAIGISSHASNYGQIVDVVEILRKRNLDKIPVFCGGTIPKSKVIELKRKGVAEVFLPRSTSKEIVDCVLRICNGRKI